MSRTVTGAVLRAVPRLGPIWDEFEQGVSAPMLDLAAGPVAVFPAGILTAWWRVSAAVRAEQVRPADPGGPCPDLCLVTVRTADVDTLGAGARRLGRALIPGADDNAADAVRRALAGHRTSPGRLVVDLACLHGLLEIDHGPDGDLLHLLAGVRTTAASVVAAHERVSARVARMWAAGAD